MEIEIIKVHLIMTIINIINILSILMNNYLMIEKNDL